MVPDIDRTMAEHNRGVWIVRFVFSLQRQSNRIVFARPVPDMSPLPGWQHRRSMQVETM